MSMYYDPQIVKLLMAERIMAERIKEALDAGRISRARSEERAAIEARKVSARSLGIPTRASINPSTCSC